MDVVDYGDRKKKTRDENGIKIRWQTTRDGEDLPTYKQ
jgi:hypothetical protein